MPPPPIHPILHRSKAQTSFFKILHIISVFSNEDADQNQCLSINEQNCENKELNFDLNVRLSNPTEIEPFEPLVTTEDVGDAVRLRLPMEIEPLAPPVTAKHDGDGENCVKLRHPTEIEPFTPPVTTEHDGDGEYSGESCDVKRTVEDSEICDAVDRRFEIDCKGRDEGYLGLLIEAAQLILGENESTSSIGKCVELQAEIGGGTKRKQESLTTEWWSEFDGRLPALKSKRGRNVVLPEKYRDSFVEPLIRWTPSVKRRSKW